MTKEWCYVKEANGKLYVTNAKPDTLSKGEYSWGIKPGCPGYWYEVVRTRENKLYVCSNNTLLSSMDLNSVPEPEWTDEHPTIIVQTITQTYYTID